MTSPASTHGGNSAMIRPFALVFLLALTTGVQAGPLVEAATAIEAKLATGDAIGALDGARDLMAQVWDQSPALSFGQALLVAEPATGYGVFNPRSSIVFKKGDPIQIYCEPFGFGYGSPGEGLHSVNFIVDLQVLDASGNQLALAEGATEFNMTSRHQNREVQANITYNLDGIPVGRYTLITTLRDKNSLKSGSFQTAIEIIE